VEQVLGIAEGKAGDAPECHVGVNGGRHDLLCVREKGRSLAREWAVKGGLLTRDAAGTI